MWGYDKPYWLKVGKAYGPRSDWDKLPDEQKEIDFNRYLDDNLDFPCFDCGLVLVKTQFKESRYGLDRTYQKKIKFCSECLEYHKIQRTAYKARKEAEDIQNKLDMEKVALDVKNWPLAKHDEIIVDILKPFLPIREAYLDKLQEIYNRIAADYGGKISADDESGKVYDAAKANLLPEFDIELQYYLPGIPLDIFYKLVKPFHGWHTHTEPCGDYRALLFTVRSNSVDLNKVEPNKIQRRFFEDKLGLPGKFICLVTVDHRANI